MRKIIVFCPNWVGDAVMATPTLRALRELHPAAEIKGLMLAGIAETLAGNPWLNDYLILNDFGEGSRRWWNVVSRLRQEKFDLGVLLTNNFLSAAVSWLGGVRRRIGYDREGRGLLLTDPVSAGWTLKGYKPNPVLDYYLRLVERVGAKSPSRRMELFTRAPDEQVVDQLWRKWGLGSHVTVVTLNPGAAFGPAKRWPTESFGAFARRVVDELRAKVVILCGPGEKEIARAIAERSERHSSVFTLADEKVSIGISKAVVARSSILVSTDSGPRHFGAAFGIPVVALFGPTHIAWSETHYPEETKLQRIVPCGPCQQRSCPMGHHRCMNELSVEEVFESTRNLLGRSGTRRDRPARVA